LPGLAAVSSRVKSIVIAKLAATAIFVLLLRKRGIGGKRLLGITWMFFYGTFLTVMLFMHNVVILGLRIFERTADGKFSYDFHLYSLILLGSVPFFARNSFNTCGFAAWCGRWKWKP
jgi:uncharacterized membrane protein